MADCDFDKPWQLNLQHCDTLRKHCWSTRKQLGREAQVGTEGLVIGRHETVLFRAIGLSSCSCSTPDCASVNGLEPLLRRIGRSGAPGTPDAVAHGSCCAGLRTGEKPGHAGIARRCKLQAHTRAVVLLWKNALHVVKLQLTPQEKGRLHGLSGAADGDLRRINQKSLVLYTAESCTACTIRARSSHLSFVGGHTQEAGACVQPHSTRL